MIKKFGTIIGVAILAVIVFVVYYLGDDFFMAIPSRIRNGMGHIAFLTIVGCATWRAVLRGNHGKWKPPRSLDPPSSDCPKLQFLLPVLMHAAVATLAWPLLRHPEYLGFGDWDHHLQKYEAIRQSILGYGQIPWWNAWCRGGFPLAAEPECGLASVVTPLVLLLGTTTGVRLGTLVFLHLAIEGARRLAQFWLQDAWGALAAGMIYGLNGAVIIYTAAGHYIPMSYCSIPWLVYFVFRLENRASNGVWLGVWFSINSLNGIQYPSVYGMVLCGVVWLVRCLVLRPQARRRFLLYTTLAVGIWLATAGWRLATMGSVMLDYPRTWQSFINNSPRVVLDGLRGRPDAAYLLDGNNEPCWETACYVGPLAMLLAVISLGLGWRWWHTLTVLCFWLALGSYHWYHPSYWLSDQWPLFKSMHQVTRWRLVAMLGLGMAVGGGVTLLRGSRLRWLRTVAVLSVLGIAADLLIYAHNIFPVASSIAPAADRFPGPQTEQFLNIERWEGPARGGKSFPQLLGFAATMRGYGVIRCHEPLLGYNRGDPTERVWREHPDYVAEFWSKGQPIEPTYWSPHRITFQLDPSQTIEANQNPGSWWLINGVPAFRGMRCAEWNERFFATADENGRLELRIQPKGWTFGVGFTLAGVLLIVASLWLSRLVPGVLD